MPRSQQHFVSLCGLLAMSWGACGGQVESPPQDSHAQGPSLAGAAGRGASGATGGSSGGHSTSPVAGHPPQAGSGGSVGSAAGSAGSGPEGGSPNSAGSGPGGGSPGSAGTAGSVPEGGSLGPEGPSCVASLLCAGLSCCESRVVPATSFPMGRSDHGTDASADTDADNYLDEQPEHEVFVDAFALDTFPVTVGRFRAFVLAFEGTAPPDGAGAHPKIPGSGWRSEWNKELPSSQAELLDDLANPSGPVGPVGIPQPWSSTWTDQTGGDEDKPINYMDWPLAFAFCIWDGGRLPTEAEWECAAAGGDENRKYPWGAAPQALPSPFAAPLRKVGSLPASQGRWGHQDLDGGVVQWVFDLYHHDWYAQHSAPGSCSNCANTDEQDSSDFPFSRASRGGSSDIPLRAARRVWVAFHAENGFRCARDL